MFFSLIQIIFWLSLSTWFGGVLFVAVAAPVIFRTVRESNPVLPTVLSVNLEGQHGTLLAGWIVANLLTTLVRAELICAAGVFVSLVGQWFLTGAEGAQLLNNVIRSAIFLGAVAIVAYDRWVLSPRVQKARDEYIDHADEPEVANPAKERFDHYHRESVLLLSILVALLLAMILFSAGLTPFARTIVFGR